MPDMGYDSSCVTHKSHIHPNISDSQAINSHTSEECVVTGEPLNASAVVDRLRDLYEERSDSALAKTLDVPTTTVSSWRTRNRVPLDQCVDAVRKFRISFDWLLLGIERDGARPTSEQRWLGNRPTDERMDRMMQFLVHWDSTHAADEVVWLEMQLARAVPEYAEWVASRKK